jgi:hypothetical protein
MIRRSRRTTELTKTRSEDDSQTHGNRELQEIQVLPRLATR